jgi:hypothetical protein
MSTEISLAQKRIGEFLCEDLYRGKECPKCAEKAERLHRVIVAAQDEERKSNAVAALERIAGFVENLPK